MGEFPLFQSSLRRAVDDTLHTPRRNPWLFWSVGTIMIALGGFLGTIYAPKDSETSLSVICTIAGVVLGAVIGIILIFLINLKLAPYRQRNEARVALQRISQTPLIVRCNSFEYYYAGKDELLRDQYIWRFPVNLTNNSDNYDVSTKSISLYLNHFASDGKISACIANLIPDKDIDKYGSPSRTKGRPLKENEYLLHRASLTGFYQFLDEDLTMFGIKSHEKWPTLVIEDSFGAIYRREFPRSRLATQSSSDKEDSQPE